MCGITTGGKENCYWDCTFVTDPYVGSLITTPECLLDCYEEVFKFGQSNNIMKLQTYLLLFLAAKAAPISRNVSPLVR